MRQLTDQDRIEFFAHQLALATRREAFWKSRVTPKSTAAQLAKYAKYRASEKGRARQDRYNGSAARQEAAARYCATGVPYRRKLEARLAGASARLAALDPDGSFRRALAGGPEALRRHIAGEAARA
jgi:hypothetical protein